MDEGNYGQVAAGVSSILAPAAKLWNPRIRYTRRGTSSTGRTTQTPIDIELGNPLYYTGSTIGLGGDIYGFVKDDAMKFI